MFRALLLIPLLSISLLSTGQVSKKGPAKTDTTQTYAAFKTDREAKAAVYNIVRYSGLTPNFTVIKEDVPNAIAYIKGKKRYIAYNPEFIAKVQDKTATNWSAISILAHEIGHHLLGHTIKFHQRNPGDELAADKYSGFILYQMGASLLEAQAAMQLVGKDEGSELHPPKKARLDAITSGWLEAQQLDGKSALDSNSVFAATENNFLFQCVFSGDENLYFVNDQDEMVWYNNSGHPIVIGQIAESSDPNFVWLYHYNNSTFSVDGNGQIWNVTTYGAMFKVGTAAKLVQPNGDIK
jgi:hypothetical protein